VPSDKTQHLFQEQRAEHLRLCPKGQRLPFASDVLEEAVRKVEETYSPQVDTGNADANASTSFTDGFSRQGLRRRKQGATHVDNIRRFLFGLGREGFRGNQAARCGRELGGGVNGWEAIQFDPPCI